MFHFLPGSETRPQRVLRAAALLMLLALLGDGCNGSKPVASGRRVEVGLDRHAWLGKGESKAVVWFLDGDARLTCADGNTYSVDVRDRIYIFEGCGSIHVVMPDGYASDNEQMTAIAVHEAFHALVQLSTRSSMRLDATESISLDMKELSTGNTTRFFMNIANALSVQDGGLSCNELQGMFLSLSSGERRYVVWGSYIEWPAEFYMSTSLGFDDAWYLQFRKGYSGWTDVDWKYVAGYFAMKRIDVGFGRESWQTSYTNGQHPLDALWSSLGCEGRLLPPSSLVKYSPGAFHPLSTLGESSQAARR